MAIEHEILTKNGIEIKELTPMKAIRQKCMECSNWQYSEVRDCHIEDCALWPYRMGRNPTHTAVLKS
jgi:hypothetical protein